MSGSGTEVKCFYVVRVDGDNLDTHAARTLQEALELAAPDTGAVVEYSRRLSVDAGSARLPGRIESIWELISERGT